MKEVFYILLVLIAVLTSPVGSTPTAQQEGPDVSNKPKEPVIGCLIPLSGSKAAYGNEALLGALVAAGAFEPAGSGQKPKLIIEDTNSDPKVAGYKIKKLAERGAIAIFGTLTESEAEAAAEIAQNLGIPIILMNRGAKFTDKGEFVFHNFIEPEAEIQALVDFAKGYKGINHFGCLYPNNQYGQEYSQFFKSYLETYKFNVPCLSYAPDEVDFKKQILELRSQLGKNAANYAIFIPDFPNRLRLLLPQIFFWELEGAIFLGSEGWCDREMHEKMSRYTKNAFFVCPFWLDDPRTEVTGFIEKFQKALNRPPSLIAAFAYDNAQILIHCANKSADPKAIRTCLSSLQGFHGACGITSFTPNRRGTRNLHILRFDRSGSIVRAQ